MKPHRVSEAAAAVIAEWFRTRGGIASWGSVNLSNLETGWTTPLRDADGNPAGKPNWQAGSAPRVITDPAEVVVETSREVKRFRVGVRMASGGMSVKVTDGGTRRIRKEVAKAGENAWYEFDYFSQEAVILVPDTSVPLTEHPVWQASESSLSA